MGNREMIGPEKTNKENTYPVFAKTSLITSKQKIGNGIGNLLVINSQTTVTFMNS